MNFYHLYLELCNEIKKSPSAVALEIGLSKTAVNGWKTKGTKPTDANLQKIADYFGVTVEYLKGETDIKKPPITKDERIDELYEMAKDLTDAELVALKAFVAGLKANKKLD